METPPQSLLYGAKGARSKVAAEIVDMALQTGDLASDFGKCAVAIMMRSVRDTIQQFSTANPAADWVAWASTLARVHQDRT